MNFISTARQGVFPHILEILTEQCMTIEKGQAYVGGRWVSVFGADSNKDPDLVDLNMFSLVFSWMLPVNK